MKKLLTLLLCTVLFLPIASCEKMKNMSSKHVRSIIDDELSLKDTSQEIENFLNSKGITYSYDKYNRRYQCIVRDKDVGKHSIVIYINVDEEKRYVSSEVFDSYTGI